jgi:effector-binding domain-containing protein
MEAGARSSVGVLENEWRIGPRTQLFLYHHAERRNEAMNIDFGVQVERPFEREGDVRCIETPTGEVARTVHVGPYDRLGDAHNAIHAWCAANNRKIAQTSWEIYGHWNDDSALLETTIKYLLA